MKKSVFASICLSFWVFFASAQNNVVKGRLLGLPGSSPTIFTFGLGYERFFGKHFSAQALFFTNGTTPGGGDSGSKIMTSFLPEIRYFQKENKRRSAFAGIFGGWANLEEAPGGECFPCWQETSGEGVFGFVFGQTLPFGRKMGFELYGGPRFAFGNSTREITAFPPANEPTVRKAKYFSRGFRTGLNIFYNF